MQLSLSSTAAPSLLGVSATVAASESAAAVEKATGITAVDMKAAVQAAYKLGSLPSEPDGPGPEAALAVGPSTSAPLASRPSATSPLEAALGALSFEDLGKPGFTKAWCLSVALEFMARSPLPLILTDSVGRIQTANSSWVDLCGYSSAEVEGKTCAVLQGAGDRH